MIPAMERALCWVALNQRCVPIFAHQLERAESGQRERSLLFLVDDEPLLQLFLWRWLLPFSPFQTRRMGSAPHEPSASCFLDEKTSFPAPRRERRRAGSSSSAFSRCFHMTLHTIVLHFKNKSPKKKKCRAFTALSTASLS